ncbi:VOC family protein [Patulibacter sp.]|uniref:VOC family protein n=1 Tax=Patulibacter sp. TaxID=1912859 RepID=UPI002717B4F7|nr:VOC family protein [Patulibacter sp.]MDO9407305.1 VOC family protein [Patulibacter sp.]
MQIDHVLAVVPVSDIDRADRFFETLFGRPADNRPMPSLVEWRAVDAGWVQVHRDADRAGSGLLNLAVADLQAAREELVAAGLDVGEIQSANKGVQLLPLADPDGNVVTLLGGFRVTY